MRRLIAAAALLSAALLVAGCSTTPPQNTEDNKATGSATLTIGIADDLPGVSLKTDEGYAGFDIDTANYVAG
ncbi:MAG: glutamate-binding protein, partial [Microbacterium sp.]|nr:glutamate-binding protein [Microbacterium sp.]